MLIWIISAILSANQCNEIFRSPFERNHGPVSKDVQILELIKKGASKDAQSIYVENPFSYNYQKNQFLTGFFLYMAASGKEVHLHFHESMAHKYLNLLQYMNVANNLHIYISDSTSLRAKKNPEKEFLNLKPLNLEPLSDQQILKIHHAIEVQRQEVLRLQEYPRDFAENLKVYLSIDSN
tara:strand:- start:8659 stop:9198 length:540 start_codon:yes stop_codon:yes gene_type:complete